MCVVPGSVSATNSAKVLDTRRAILNKVSLINAHFTKHSFQLLSILIIQLYDCELILSFLSYFQDINMSTVQSLVCGDCTSTVTFSTLEELKRHYVLRHNQRSVFTCGEIHCKTQLLNKTSLIRHIQEQHPYLIGRISGHHVNPGVFAQGSSTNDHVLQDPGDNDDEYAGNEDHVDDGVGAEEIGPQLTSTNVPHMPDQEPPSVDMNKLALKMIMDLRSKGSLTGKAIERFQEGCTTLLKGYREIIIHDLSIQLRDCGLSELQLGTVLNGIRDVGDIFSNLKSIEDQLNAFAEEFGLVKPMEKYLGFRLDKRLDPQTNSYFLTQVKISFQYISIIQTLETILSNKKNRDAIFKDWTSQDDVLRSYFDGSHFKDHPFLKKHENVIHILLFFDELEVANSLGSKTIIHKLGTFFFQILNGSAEASSKLSSIHLLILAYSEDLKRPGAWTKVLTPFISEMKKLSSDKGVQISIDGQPVVIRALLTAVTADTLAAHDLLGFMGPGANHFCRCCSISRSELRRDGNHVAALRTREAHAQQLQEVRQNQKRRSLYGVNKDCPLNVLPYFHCVESSVYDAFHDLLEGVVPLVIKLVLRYFICIRKLLSIDDFNSRVESFCYGLPDAKNRPSPNFTTEMLLTRKKLKQTGSQMWCLMRALPFLLMDNVEDMNEADEDHMKLVFLMQNIMRIVFAFEVTQEDLDQLDILLTQHHDLFKRLFIDAPVILEAEEAVEEPAVGDDEFYNEEAAVDEPDTEEYEGDEEASQDEEVQGAAENEEEQNSSNRRKKKKRKPLVINFINKMHHLKHYISMIRRFGPAVRMWCAKFEGRLKIFRQHSAVCCNFKNVPKTMAQMFQLSNISALHDEDEGSLEYKPGTNVQVINMASDSQLFQNLGFADTYTFVLTNSVSLNGEEYRPGFFVRLASPDRHVPLFAVIVRIYVDASRKSVHLLVNPWKVQCFSLKYNCYKVVPNVIDNHSVVSVSCLENFRAIAPWFVAENDDIYLSLRTGTF